jgi:hypothetical protein
MPLTPAQYTERRNTLAMLLADTTEALQSVSNEAQHIEPGLINRHIAELTAIQAKVFENQFKLVLVARFQGGKSTTFNAVAMGGRVISPMGDGAIKCSASLISNYNCEDATKRGVTLKWRSTDDLARLCEDVLTNGKVDLTTPEGRRVARQAFEEEFETYKANRQTYPATQLELLPIVDLITRFAGNAALAAMQEQLAINPPTEQQVAELVRFPSGFSTRWPEQANGFTVEEARFVFLQGANMATDAPNLKQLGLEVIDCPGLFASSYDTTVATAMIATADAVWYLLDGKTAGQSDLEAIALCRQLAQNALFVSVNLKADINPTRKHITTKIIPHIQGQLQQAGLSVELQPYHALLALLGQTGESLLRGEEDADTAAFMHQLVDDWSLESASADAAGDWAALCEHLLDRLKSGVQDFQAAGGQLNAQAVAVVVRESGLSEILGKLGQFVVETRARAILIDRGVGQAIGAVENGIERPLAALEESARMDVDTALSQYRDAETVLSRFEAMAEEQMDSIQGDLGSMLDSELAGEFFDEVIIKSIPSIARKSAVEIVNKVGASKMFAGLLGNKLQDFFGIEKTQNIIQSIIQKQLKIETEPRTAEWIKQLSPKSSRALESMLKTAKRITDALNEFWELAKKEGGPLKEVGEPVVPATTFDVSGFSDLTTEIFAKDIGVFVTKQALITGILTGIAVLLPGIGTIFVVITSIVAAVFISLTKDNNKTIEKMTDKLVEGLSTQLQANRRVIVDHLLNPTDASSPSLKNIRESLIAVLNKPIKETRERFDSQRHAAESIFLKKNSEREEIAADCRRLRLERVVPLRERLQAYKDQTLKLC